jgi:hypothetical protein
MIDREYSEVTSDDLNQVPDVIPQNDNQLASHIPMIGQNYQ